jgi:hypothetical protein
LAAAGLASQSTHFWRKTPASIFHPPFADAESELDRIRRLTQFGAALTSQPKIRGFRR